VRSGRLRLGQSSPQPPPSVGPSQFDSGGVGHDLVVEDHSVFRFDDPIVDFAGSDVGLIALYFGGENFVTSDGMGWSTEYLATRCASRVALPYLIEKGSTEIVGEVNVIPVGIGGGL
jgi:hypothetical protein